MDKEKIEQVLKQNERNLEMLKFDQWITEKVNIMLKKELEDAKQELS